jgi:hypothetical protein
MCEKEKRRERQTDRQAGMQADRQTDRERDFKNAKQFLQEAVIIITK